MSDSGFRQGEPSGESRDLTYLIGRIIKPHGIKGDVRVEIITDFPERFLNLKEVHASPPGGGAVQLYHVESARLHKQWVILSLSEIQDRNEAETLRNYDLTVPEGERWIKDDDFFYLHELEGLPVYLPGGERVGEVNGFDRGGQLLLVIQTGEGKSIMVPFISRFVEVERGERITLHPIPGLLSLGSKHED